MKEHILCVMPKIGSKDDSSIIRESVLYKLFAVRKVQRRWVESINLGTLINVFLITVP